MSDRMPKFIVGVLLFGAGCGAAGYSAGRRSRNKEISDLNGKIATRESLMDECYENGRKAMKREMSAVADAAYAAGLAKCQSETFPEPNEPESCK